MNPGLSRLPRIAVVSAAAAAVLAIAGCAAYPYEPAGYSYPQQTPTYSQPAYPPSGYAPPSGYYESREYVRPPDALPVQPVYPQPYGYAPAYPGAGVLIYGGSGGRRGDDFDREHGRDEHRRDERGHDERRDNDHHGDGGHGGQRHDGDPHADPRMRPGDDHGQNHGLARPENAQRGAPPVQPARPVPPVQPVQPQVRAQPAGVPPQPAPPQAPGPRRDRD